jgi:hypothetical protein
MIFQWQIGPAKVYSTNQLKDIVSAIHWQCMGTAPDGTTYKASGTVDMPPPDPAKFTPFANLTKAQIETVVWNRVIQTAVQDSLTAQYAASATPPVKPFNY